MAQLRRVLETFRMHHLTLNLEKMLVFFSIFGIDREISAQGVRPDLRKIEALAHMRLSRTVKQV